MSDVRPAPMDSLRYITYLRLLARIFHHFITYYNAEEKKHSTSEAESMALYAQKFLATITAFRLKYRYNPVYLARPNVALTESGFPAYSDITQLDADRSTRDERLPKLAPIDEARELLLEHLMDVPTPEGVAVYNQKMFEYLWQIAERAYLESLDLRTQFFQFTPGKLFPVPNNGDGKSDPTRRTYLFSWGCYDAESNQPCVYFLLFEQDVSATPLDAPNNPTYLKFLEIVRHVGARAPANLSAVAIRLDESFEKIYPKALKRVRIGPLVSPLLYKSLEDADQSSLAARLIPVFERAKLADHDYALFISTEYVHSEREVSPRGVLATDKKRQIFDVPKNDRELSARGATAVSTSLLCSHLLRQHITDEDLARIPELKNITYLVYPQQEGEVIDVG